MTYPTKKLGKIIIENSKSKIKVRDASEKGDHIFFTSGKRTLRFNEYLCEGRNLFIATGGKAIVQFFNGKSSYSTDTYSIKGSNDIDTLYLYYYLISIIKFIDNNLFSGAGIRHLQKKEFKNLSIPTPALPTQKLIVQKLDSAFKNIDESINITKKNIENIEELNKSVLEKIFRNGKFQEKTIDEIAEIKSGKRLPKGERVLDDKTSYPYIRVSDFTNDGTIDLSNIKYITKDTFNKISRYIITDKDFYISIAGTIGKTGIIPSKLNGANLTENAVRLVYKNINNIFNKYIYYFTISNYFKEQAGLATRVVAMPKLAISRLKQIKIPLPTLEKQKEIVSYLDEVFEKNKIIKEGYEKKLKELEEMKQSILKEAFEGRLVKE